MKYKVKVKFTVWDVYEVEAESEDEAYEKAEEMAGDKSLNQMNSEFEGCTILDSKGDDTADEEDEDEPEFKVHELCCDKDIFEAEEIVKKEFGAKFSDNGINDGLEDGVYLMYRSYSLPNGKSIVLYYPNDTNIVTDTRYY